MKMRHHFNKFWCIKSKMIFASEDDVMRGRLHLIVSMSIWWIDAYVIATYSHHLLALMIPALSKEEDHKKRFIFFKYGCATWVNNFCGSFTNASRVLQINLTKICNARRHIYGENVTLKLCTFAQSMALHTHLKFQLEIIIRSTISVLHNFRENMLESSWNVSETIPVH